MSDKDEMKTIAQLEVHKYFDHYLTEIFPQQVQRFLDGHQNACPWGKKLNRIIWTAVGFSLAIGVGGTLTVEQLLHWASRVP